MLRINQLDAFQKPYKIYTDYVENEALNQFIGVMARPDTIRGALMPDVHAGYTLPIGGVVQSHDRIYPEYVGVDIGCGMYSATIEGLTAEEVKAKIGEITEMIKEKIPVGFNSHPKAVHTTLATPPAFIKDLAESKSNQLGTLGGGNHFIEIGEDQSTHAVRITIHSGSRGLGHAVATKYIKLSNGEGFIRGTPMFKEYLEAIQFVSGWAWWNRKLMAQTIVEALGRKVSDEICCVHNFADVREDGVYHWKGANNLQKGQRGVIPANMRDGVYIVRGKGSEEAMDSVSHGAGRVMSRGAAKRQFSLDDFKEAMAGLDLSGFSVDEARIDESPMAYKNIDTVMEFQKDLCDVIEISKPLLNIKG